MSATTSFPALGNRKGWLRGIRTLGPGILAAAKARAVPAASHLRDHGLTICGLGCISGAAFVHSIFTGLLVSGIEFLAYEWKVSE